jgi:CRISPR-associated protein Cmr3
VRADLPAPDYEAIARGRRCRLVLTSPGLFPGGWLPTGCVRTESGQVQFGLGGVTARLVSAAVPRAEVVSGWDVARWRPKPARRAAPIGSVYWLEDLDTTAEDLRKLVESGLWGEPCEDAPRRAEGFNRFTFAAWP